VIFEIQSSNANDFREFRISQGKSFLVFVKDGQYHLSVALRMKAPAMFVVSIHLKDLKTKKGMVKIFTT